MTKAISHPEWQEYYDFLDELRESGVTNMLASPAYLRREFDLLDTKESYAICGGWMKEFGNDEAAA